ncbi:hypothetical protein A2634_00495 [Candidatus Amesbacteria bacterium RIFCSPHIGHO2_01_FULL_48_32]|uniref:Uncharacterized protein n=1 Tax=Candidatus Amesbacteria bacterium RIFCSPLOWO2_01_FULL_48_25 TaxID=1797259 RepID=A0A1F4ZBH3_9BACT|nr:MAG: hypothetical protein A2634_00495 [Candidatus Amesbacteria bacterium RIFCSPHIGHO2_01_FULL_48_32]OGD03286.1 MAG: hypothetical protein A2989_00445 [Candidatus Amesbacteria bacterium RIFCSPLOWO2_01_FULL_48_25]HJZ05234.1 hypothetical protein [Patescibacteria group bacterium]
MPLTTNPQEVQFFLAAAKGGLNAAKVASEAGDLKEGLDALQRVAQAVTALETSVITNSPNLRQLEKDRLLELHTQNQPAKDGLTMGLTSAEAEERDTLMDKVLYGEPIQPQAVVKRRLRKIRRPNTP